MTHSAQIISTVLRDPLRIAQELGGDISGLCRAAAIGSETLSSENGSIPLRQFVELNQIAAAHLSAPHFGRIVGSEFHIGNIGDVGRAALAAPTLGAALRLLERSFIVVQGDTQLRLDVADGTACLSYRILDPTIWPRDQDAELTLGVLVAMVSQAAGRGWCPEGLSFEHAPQGAECRTSVLRGYPVTYGAETNAVLFSADLLDRPMPQRDPEGYQRMSSALSVAARQSERLASLSTRVRGQVLRQVGSGTVCQDEIARNLGLSPRNLRRRLADEGTSFANILGQCRDDCAKLFLRQIGMTIPEIADRLGYSEASGFERAFRRRTGQTPAQYRQRQHHL